MLRRILSRQFHPKIPNIPFPFLPFKVKSKPIAHKSIYIPSSIAFNVFIKHSYPNDNRPIVKHKPIANNDKQSNELQGA